MFLKHSQEVKMTQKDILKQGEINTRKVLCSKIVVDCVPNDSVDIHCGGPIFLGFDFYVPHNKAQEMLLFIEEALKEFNIPLINLFVEKEEMIDKKNVFTKERIVAILKKDKEYLQEEAKIKEKVYINNHVKAWLFFLIMLLTMC